MTKLLITIDDYIYYHGGRYYFDSSTSHGMVERYLRIFDQVKILARVKQIEQFPEMHEEINIEGGKVSIYHLPFLRRYEYLYGYFQLRRRLYESTKDCEHFIIRLPSIIGFIIARYLIKESKMYAVEVVADPKPYKVKINIFYFLFQKYLERLQKAIVANSFAVSYVTSRYLQVRYPASNSKIHSHYSSIDLAKSYFTSVRNGVNNINNITIINVSLHINSFSKGQDIVLKVAKRVIDMGCPIKVIFVGEGKYIIKLKKMAKKLGIANRVIFIGYLSKSKLRNALINSDLLLFPSVSEGLPRIVLESGAVGLPCVASNVGGIPELLSSDVIFNYSDIVGMSRKVFEILNNQEYYRLLSKTNYEMSLNYISDELQKRRDEFYSNIRDNYLSNK